MGTVYAIANQKGGVGKTTTAVNLAACVAEAGYETLLVDIDPQSNATIALGIGKDSPRTVYDVLIGEVALEEVLVPTRIEHLTLAPSGPDLAGATVELPRLAGSETRLRESIAGIRERYSFILFIVLLAVPGVFQVIGYPARVLIGGLYRLAGIP